MRRYVITIELDPDADHAAILDEIDKWVKPFDDSAFVSGKFEEVEAWDE